MKNKKESEVILRILNEANSTLKIDPVARSRNISLRLMMFSILTWTCWQIFLEIWLKLRIR